MDWSPYSSQLSSASSSVKVVKQAVLVLLTVIVLAIVVTMIIKLQLGSNRTNMRFNNIKQANDDELYNAIVGDNVDDVSRSLADRLTNKSTKTVHDLIMLGNLWYYVLHDQDIAGRYYTTAMTNMGDNGHDDDHHDTRSHVDDLARFIMTENIDSPILNLDHLQATLLTLFDSHIVDGQVDRATYLDDAKKVRSDPQNVHDTAVNSQLKEQYDFIKRTLTEHKVEPTELASIKAFVLNHPHVKGNEKAVKTIKLYYDALDANLTHLILKEHEITIYCTLWSYIHLPEQSAQRLELEDSFIDSMINAYETNSYTEGIVCINGRVGGLFASLAMLDHWDQGKLMSSDMMRSECFSLARAIRDRELAAADPVLVAAYNNDGEITPEVVELTQRIKDKMTDELTVKYTGIMPKEQLRMVITEAHLGV
jgi:hypothetical protein